MAWHLLPTLSAPMSLQMALDEALFQRTKNIPDQSPLLRFYYSSGPWITVGFSYPSTPREYTPEVYSRGILGSALIRKNPGVPVAKRITGGGCVLHGDDLIFSLIARYEQKGGQTPFFSVGGGVSVQRVVEEKKVSDPLLGSVKTSYQKIHEAVKLAFQGLGFDPRFYEEREDLPKGDDCFDFPVESDLFWKDRKIAGGAQKRSEGVLLHHESVRVPDGASSAELIEGIRDAFAAVFEAEFSEANLDAELYFERAKQRGL